MEQYEQEARLLVRLNHPNLPKVTDAFVDGDRFYLVMDFVEGATLDYCLRLREGKPVDPATVVDLSIEIADVLGYLHSQNPPIIFRDLKPSNIMVQPDKHIKLIDFGIARRFQPGASKDTSLLGSVGYSPPEQFGKHQTDKRSDIYALGATMHNMLTAIDPATTPFRFVPVEQISPNVPNSLSRLVANCVAMEPDARPADARVVSAELHAIRDVLNHVVSAPARADIDPKATARMATIGTVNNSWMSGSKTLLAGTSNYSRRVSTIPPLIRLLVVALVAVGISGATAVSLDNGSRHFKITKKASRTTSSRKVSNSGRRTKGRGAYYSSSGNYSSVSSGNGGNGESDSSGQGSGDSGQQSAETDSSSSGARVAQCSAEVVGTSPDGKSLRLHVTGEVNGKKDTSGSVAAYFYKTDRTPLRSRDPKGQYATPSGQLFAELTFQIDEDPKSIDELIDIPVDQFPSTKNLMFKCIIYADNKSAVQTELMPCSTDIAEASG
jgi:serine/threonine protein kinase